MSTGGSDEGKTGDGDRVPGGKEKGGIVRAMGSVKSARNAARKQPRNCTSEGRFLWRTVAQCQEEDSERANASERNEGQASHGVRAEQLGRPHVRWNKEKLCADRHDGERRSYGEKWYRLAPRLAGPRQRTDKTERACGKRDHHYEFEQKPW